MYHSNQIREFKLTDEGIKLIDVYLGPAGILTGSARVSQIAKEKAEKLSRIRDIESKQREIERKREIIESQLKEIKAKFKAEKEELDKIISQDKLKEDILDINRKIMKK